MRQRVLLGILLAIATTIEGRQISWKADHILDSSGRVIAIVTPTSTDQTAPTAPTDLHYSDLNPTSIRMDWSASTDTGGSGLGGYKIYRGTLPVGSVGPTVLFFRDDSIQPGTPYTYTVVAFDNAQNQSGPSNEISFTSPTNSASDNFNRPDGPIGSSWTVYGTLSLAPVIRSNRLGTDSAFTSNRTARYTAFTWASDHYSQITLSVMPYKIGMAAVRMQTTNNYYAGGYDNNSFNNSQGTERCRIVKYVNAFPTSLALDNTCIIAAGDTLKLEAQGTTLRLYVNGVLKLTTTDSTYTGGSPGITYHYNQTNASLLDDWFGGNL